MLYYKVFIIKQIIPYIIWKCPLIYRDEIERVLIFRVGINTRRKPHAYGGKRLPFLIIISFKFLLGRLSIFNFYIYFLYCKKEIVRSFRVLNLRIIFFSEREIVSGRKMCLLKKRMNGSVYILS